MLDKSDFFLIREGNSDEYLVVCIFMINSKLT